VLLYDSPPSGNAYKARLLLAHLDLEYERRIVDVFDRSNKREELDGLNPMRRVPTLVLDDGRPIAESGAILWYLGDGTPFVPDDRYLRAQVLQWLFFEQYDLQPALAFVRFVVSFTDRAEELAVQVAERTKAGHRALAALERHLDGNDFLVGGTFSIADVALYAYTHIAHEGNFDLGPYAAVRAWHDRVASVEGHAPMEA
jgi:glutathione S-transferase